MNLNKKLKNELVSAVLRDQFGKDIESKIEFIRVKTSELSEKLHGDATKKIIEIAKSAGLENNVSTRDVADLSDFPCVDFRSNLGLEYISNRSVALNKSVVCRYSYWIEPTEEIRKAQKDLMKIKKEWKALHSDLEQVINSVRTVKKLKELTDVFNPFLPSQIAGTQIVPVEPLLRINELKSPKNK